MGKERMSSENKVQYEKEPVRATMVGRGQMVITIYNPLKCFPKHGSWTSSLRTS